MVSESSASNPATGTEVYAATFRALAEPVRLSMLREIASVVEMPCTVLQSNIGLAKSTCSYHIKILHEVGLISVRRDGRNYFYTAQRPTIQQRLPGFLSRVGVPRRPRVTPTGVSQIGSIREA